jgi:hypothetical protein
VSGILVDTSVWIDHFRRRNEALVDLVEGDRVLMHPFIVAEIACGTPPAPRAQTLEHLRLLRPCHRASLDETMTLIEQERLYGLGCGVVDLLLLASTLITPAAVLWTLDERLRALAERFHVAHTDR